MCFFHVSQANMSKIEKINDSAIRDSLHLDIRDIQRCQDTSIFSKAIELFNEKYKTKGDRVQEFLEYFNREWVSKHPGWYEGFLGSLGPSTNNGLESINADIKRSKTLRKLMSLPAFINLAFSMLKEWSYPHIESNVDCKQFQISPLIENKEYTAAYQFRQEKRAMKTKSSRIFNYYYFKSTDGIARSGQLTTEQMERYIKYRTKLSYPSLDHFFVLNFDIIETAIPKDVNQDSFNQAYCSCTIFFKKNICKHILAICSMRNIYEDPVVTIPMAAKNLAIGQKIKRGRPALAKKALVRQENLKRIADFESEPESDHEPEQPAPKSAKTVKSVVKRASKRLASKQ